LPERLGNPAELPKHTGMRRAPATVVIPVWNAWEHTQRCLDSLRPTLGLRDKVIVVDNGSSDATAAELARRSWVTVITNAENRGFAAACNQGAAAATTGIVVFLNNDTLLPSRWLDALLAPLEEDEIVAAGPRSNAVSGPQLVADCRYDPTRVADLQRFARSWRENNRGTTDVERLVGFCLAVRASAFAEIGGFDERFEVGGYEDDDLCLRLRDAGGRLVIAHESFVHHVGHQTFDANDVDWHELQERNRTVLEAKHADEGKARGGLVSACLIVRDEAANILPCLYALKDFVDEVVVYDTGSVDGTPELAASAGAKVIRGYWDDDFGRARNAALAECAGTWILWVDADELLLCDDPAQMRSRLGRSSGTDGYLISISNSLGDGSGQRSMFMAPRLFRRASARWAGRVHEQLVPVHGQKLQWRQGLAMGIDHQGYLDAVMFERNKSDRNLRLVQLALQEDPDNLVVRANLGRALLVAGRHREAIDACAAVIGRTDVDPGVRRRALEATIDSAIRLRSYDEALASIATLRALGGAEVVVALHASRIAVLTGDPERALAELDVLRPGLVDSDGARIGEGMVAEIRADALYGLRRPSDAADVLLDALRAGHLSNASLGIIVVYLRWADRQLDELVELATTDELRMVLLATVAQVGPPAAGELLEALWRATPGDLSVLVAASGDGGRMAVDDAVTWSGRLRERGLGEHCPLVALALNETRTPQDRVLGAAIATAVFGDERAFSVIGRAAVAVPPVDRPTMLRTLDQLCPAAVPLVTALYSPEIPAGTAYRCSVVLPVVADVPMVIAALQALAASSTGEDAEVICVSDGIDDDRDALLSGLGGDVRVVRLPLETGLAHAYNVGIAAAAGDLVVLLHPAATVASGWLAVVMDTVAPGRCVSVGSKQTGPALVAATRADLLSAAGLDSRLPDAMALSDLVQRLTALRVRATHLSPALAGWQQNAVPSGDVALGKAVLPIWDRLALPVASAGRHAPVALPTGPAPRVRVHGFLNGEMGLAEAARGLVDSLEAAGVVCATHSYGGHANRNDHPFVQRLEDGGTYPVELLCFNADHIGNYLSNGTLQLAGEHKIGLWYWELEFIPAWMIAGLRYVDEVWVGSDFIRDALRKMTRVPVLTVPPPVSAHVGRPTFSRTEVGLPEGFLFGFMFDHNSQMERKNPLGAIEAFRAAFTPGEGPKLVIKAVNGAHWPENHARLVHAVAQHPDISLMDQYLPAEVNAAFTGLFDCWVSLHRAEGFGLTMAEAMGWGTPVVGTAYSANLDYMDDTNSYLVPYVPTTVRPGVAAYTEGELWAEPDVAAAARILREVWSNPAEAAVRGERGRQTILTRYSALAVGSAARVRLEEIVAALPTPAATIS
jgi:GT2 family glycosyltransferase/glycosyltransferase involved in cell wall biosynthesis